MPGWGLVEWIATVALYVVTRPSRTMLRKSALPALVLVLFCVIAVPSITVGSARAATVTARASGSVAQLGGYYLTIKRPGRARGVIAAMITAANRITAADYPYVWGGGHGQAGVASIGQRGGNGFNGKRKGFDCSGSVAAVLVAAGIWPQGSGVPSDAGVIAYLRSQHMIAKGAGKGPNEVTLYDHPGVHIFMNIDGRFFGTSDGAGGGDSRGGPGWLDDGAWDVYDKHFKRYHFLPSVLRQKTTAGLMLSFSIAANPALIDGLKQGDKVSVAYTTSSAGTMVAQTIKLAGESSLSGTVGTISTSGSSATFTVTTGSGTYTMTPISSSLLYGLADGDAVTVGYTKQGAEYLARSITITSTVGSTNNGSVYGRSPTGGGSGIAPQPSSGGSGL